MLLLHLSIASHIVTCDCSHVMAVTQHIQTLTGRHCGVTTCIVKPGNPIAQHDLLSFVMVKLGIPMT